MKIHAIAGMHRAGSSALCAVLRQNPRFYPSNTSCTAQAVKAVSAMWSRSPEIKSELIRDKAGTEERMDRALRSMVHSWYEGSGEVVFDKCRFWNHSAILFHHLFPESKIIAPIRDLRNILASLEKKHLENPILDDANNPNERTLYARADRMFSPDGMLGQQVVGVEDLIRRRLPFVRFVQFETFVQNPEMVTRQIYDFLGEEYYQHDFSNVESGDGHDVDGLYNYKISHAVSGPIEDPGTSWPDYVPGDIANLILQKFPGYNQSFGYQ